MIIYITDINFNLISAQRKQVFQMIKALNVNKLDYCIFSNENINDSLNNIVINRKTYGNRLNIITRALIFARDKRDVFFYSRHLMFALLPLFFGYKSAYEIHDIPKKKSGLFIQKLATRYCGLKIISISENLSRILISKGLNVTLTAPDAVDVALYERHSSIERPAPLLKAIGDRPYILHTGSLRKGSEISYLITLSGVTNMDIVQLGCTEEEIRIYSDRYSGLNNVHFLPYIFDEEVVASIQLNAYLLLHLMSMDNLYFNVTSPLKVYEYLATGIPAIFCRSGAMADVVENLNDSQCYDADNHSDFKRAFSFVLTNYDSCCEAALSYKSNANSFSWNSRVNTIGKELGWIVG